MRAVLLLLSVLILLVAATRPTPSQTMTSRTELIRTVTIEPDARGHYYIDALVRGIDGERRNLRFLVDTGATSVSIRESDLAGFAFLDVPTPGPGVIIADGSIVSSSSAYVSALSIGPIQLSAQRVNVMRSLGENLLGMSALKHLNMRMQNGRLTFMQRISPAT